MYAKYVSFVLVCTIFSNITCTLYCSNISQKYSPLKRYVSVHGEKRDIVLYWGSDPTRAASALFAAFLRYRLGYQNVRLHQDAHDLQVLAASVPHTSTRDYKEVIFALSTRWEPSPPPDWWPYNGRKAGLAGPRLEELGASEIPTRQYLFLYLAEEYRGADICTKAITWAFYTNTSALALCGFIDGSFSNEHMEKAVMYELEAHNKTILIELQKRAQASKLHIQFQSINRKNLFQLLKTSNRSFIFLDYDMWSNYSNVTMIQLPPCIPNNSSHPCQQELDIAISMRIADVPTLEEYEPQLLHVVQMFRTSPDYLREILELESSKYSVDSIEDAACEWAWKSNNELNIWENEYNSSKRIYEILVFFCNDDLDANEYNTLLSILLYKITNEFDNLHATIDIWKYTEDCENVNFVKNTIVYRMGFSARQRLLGAVVNRKHITEIANNVDGVKLPVFFVDAPNVKANSMESIWISTGRSNHLVVALRKFMHDMKWGRVAILSDSTIDQNFVNILTEDLKFKKTNMSHFTFRDHPVQSKISKQGANKLLQEMKTTENARIIFLNINYENALTILEAAKGLNMTDTDGYIWILPEWRPNNLINNLRPITISFWCRSSENVQETEGRQDIRDLMDNHLLRDKVWPAKVTAMSDAILTIVHGFKEVFLSYPETQNDVHSNLTLTEFSNSVKSTPIIGTTQNLTYKDRSLEEILVFVEEWNGEQSKLLARWRVNATAHTVYVEDILDAEYIKYANVNDGATQCLVTSGDEYLPTCYTVGIAIAVLFLVLAIPSALFIYRTVKRHEKERLKKLISDILKQRQEYMTIINGYKIERSSVTMLKELGAGHFGQVRLGELKYQGTRYRVAAKSLRDNNDEKDILREASILASLEHDHIIRLIGVCYDDDEPPVLLMEYAFFGDLRHYLQDRWYLAEGATLESNTDLDSTHEEAVYVSARALTRLARQAASALAYLCQQGLVHRDVRASNYLVDKKRSLKLADFGLARKITQIGSEASAEYKSNHPGVFAVRWMAPESLLWGKFSTASDVWSLGVLIFEIVTLGADPYKDIPLLTVQKLIISGGQLSMPVDATPQTLALTQLCWKRKPEDRPTAADVVAYLAERPRALQPALNIIYSSDNTGGSISESCTDQLLP